MAIRILLVKILWPESKVDSRLPFSFLIDFNWLFEIIFIPANVVDSSKHEDRSSSKPLSKRWPLINWVTLVPKFVKIEANSHAIYPPPTIKIDSGKLLNSKISSLVHAKSIPGIFNFLGLPPTEIRIFFELILFKIFFVFGQIISKIKAENVKKGFYSFTESDPNIDIFLDQKRFLFQLEVNLRN